MVVGYIAARMRWDWATTIRCVGHLAAPFDGFLLIEVSETVFYGPRFRHALRDAVAACGLDPYKVRVTDMNKGDIYILGQGLPIV